MLLLLLLLSLLFLWRERSSYLVVGDDIGWFIAIVYAISINIYTWYNTTTVLTIKYYIQYFTSLRTWWVLWYPLFPVAALWFVASVPPSYLAGAIACLDEDSLAPSFRRYPASKQASNRSSYIFQASVKHLVWLAWWAELEAPLHSSSRSLGPYCPTLNI